MNYDNLYYLEACPVCDVVRVRISTALTMQRWRDGRVKPDIIGGAEIWRDVCPECARREKEAHEHRT